MNEAVLDQPETAMPSANRPKRARKISTSALGYTLLAAVIAVGFLVRDYNPVTPEDGVGYWLGIVGASMMLALLLYPLRKRFRILSRLGATRHWFRMHMVLGLIGPLLILYHCNFQLGSFNSRVAFYCMLLVAGSGIIGRHFYARIHRGLYGRKTNLRELQSDLVASMEKGRSLAALTPKLVTRLNAHAEELQGCQLSQSLGIRRSLKWTFTHHFTRLSLWWTARQELRQAAMESDTVRRNYRRFLDSTSIYIRDFTMLLGRVAQFSFYERLFALWHVLHLPIFLMMVLSAIAHVLAVHMY